MGRSGYASDTPDVLILRRYRGVLKVSETDPPVTSIEDSAAGQGRANLGLHQRIAIVSETGFRPAE